MHWNVIIGAGLLALLAGGCGTSGLELKDSSHAESRSFRLVKVMADW